VTAWIHDDGGRAAAGFKGDARDCVVRAIAIATGLAYREVYDALNVLGKTERPARNGRRSSAREGVFRKTYDAFLRARGWTWTPTMKIGSGCTVHLRADELPPGRLVARLSRHVVAVVDGVVHDTHDSTREGTRCVYGYWTAPKDVNP
jgi:hypothetical protein